MKKISHLIQFIFIVILFFIFRIIGYRAASNFGNLIGKTIGPIFRSKLSIIKNLEKANVNKNLNYNKIASNVFGNYGRICAEYIYLKNFRNDKLEKYISIEGWEHLENIRKNKQPVVFVSGHFSNFELMAMQIEKSGINCAAIYRPLNNPYLNKIMEKIRKRDICKYQIKKGRAGTREIISHISKGNSIALMIDQRVREGEKIPFFNKPVTTTTIPAQLVKKYKCDVVPIYIERYKLNYFKMYVSKPIKINETTSTSEISLFLNNILEKMILKNIDQWIWTHDRWKD
tara:strand:+ start:177 stop:1037 length:861 start_codon:yes stop_codon:yes gene_type:complete